MAYIAISDLPSMGVPSPWSPTSAKTGTYLFVQHSEPPFHLPADIFFSDQYVVFHNLQTFGADYCKVLPLAPADQPEGGARKVFERLMSKGASELSDDALMCVYKVRTKMRKLIDDVLAAPSGSQAKSENKKQKRADDVLAAPSGSQAKSENKKQKRTDGSSSAPFTLDDSDDEGAQGPDDLQYAEAAASADAAVGEADAGEADAAAGEADAAAASADAAMGEADAGEADAAAGEADAGEADATMGEADAADAAAGEADVGEADAAVGEADAADAAAGEADAAAGEAVAAAAKAKDADLEATDPAGAALLTATTDKIRRLQEELAQVQAEKDRAQAERDKAQEQKEKVERTHNQYKRREEKQMRREKDEERKKLDKGWDDLGQEQDDLDDKKRTADEEMRKKNAALESEKSKIQAMLQKVQAGSNGKGAVPKKPLEHWMEKFVQYLIDQLKARVDAVLSSGPSAPAAAANPFATAGAAFLLHDPSKSGITVGGETGWMATDPAIFQKLNDLKNGTIDKAQYAVGTNTYDTVRCDDVNSFNAEVSKQGLTLDTANYGYLLQHNTAGYNTNRFIVYERAQPSKGKAKAQPAAASATSRSLSDLSKTEKASILCADDAFIEVPKNLLAKLNEYDYLEETDPRTVVSSALMAELAEQWTLTSYGFKYDVSRCKMYIKPGMILMLVQMLKQGVRDNYTHFRILGHGTCKAAADAIEKDPQGFKLEYAATNGQAHGCGVYFAQEVNPTLGYAGRGDLHNNEGHQNHGSCIMAVLLCTKSMAHKNSKGMDIGTYKFAKANEQTLEAELDKAIRRQDKNKIMLLGAQLGMVNNTQLAEEAKQMPWETYDNHDLPNICIVTELIHVIPLGLVIAQP